MSFKNINSIAFVIFFSTICCLTLVESKVKFNGYKVFRIFVKSKQDLSNFAQLAADHNEELDIWHFSTKENNLSLDVSVKPNFLNQFRKILHQHQFESVILIDDLAKIIEQTSNRRVKRRISGKRKRSDSNSKGFSLYKYNSLNDIYTWLRRLNETYPNVVQLNEIGKSYEGRSILGVKIGRARNDEVAKPSFWLDGGIHSREWLSIATSLYIISQLVHKANDLSDPLLSRIDFYITPVVNPDGYQYSRKTNRLWRKTRSFVSNATNAKGKICIGVDANRNFDHQWGSVQEFGDNHPCSDGYPGKRPFSEQEAEAIGNRLKMLQHNLVGFITLHAYGQMWLAPWGYHNSKPANYQRQREVALRAIDALQGVHGTPYSFGTVSDLLYPASGTSVDFAHSLNISYTYAVELRPGDLGPMDNGYRGFLYPENKIAATGEETLAALLALTEEILVEYENAKNNG